MWHICIYALACGRIMLRLLRHKVGVSARLAVRTGNEDLTAICCPQFSSPKFAASHLRIKAWR